MSLWARFKAWWEAGQAGRQMINARRQHDGAEAISAAALTYGAHSAYMRGHQGAGSYQGPSSPDCGPGVIGDCSGTPV